MQGNAPIGSRKQDLDRSEGHHFSTSFIVDVAHLTTTMNEMPS
jgi:hypothetical protein